MRPAQPRRAPPAADDGQRKIIPRPGRPIAANAPAARGHNAGAQYPPPPPGVKTRNYTDDEIRDLVSDGYTLIPPDMWENIPVGAHVRFVKRDKGEGKPLGERFKPGGFLAKHFEKDGKAMAILETKPGGKRGQPGYVSFPIVFEALEAIWKKHSDDVTVEMHLIHNSLAQKKRQIDELMTTVAALTARIEALERGPRR